MSTSKPIHANSLASRLRRRLEGVVTQLADFVETLAVRETQRRLGDFVVVAPQYHWAEINAAQRARQFAIKRSYMTVGELLRVLLREGPESLRSGFKDADEHFRTWLELESNWSLATNARENRASVLKAGRAVADVLEVLEHDEETGIFIIPDTNALLAQTDPVAYRRVAGEARFVFMLLPAVLAELDRLKVEHRNPDVREKAKKAITRIKGWKQQGSLSEGVTVDRTIEVRAEHAEPNMADSLSWLDASNQDDRIVASVLALQCQYPAARLVLASGDINLQNKADAASIETVEIPEPGASGE